MKKKLALILIIAATYAAAQDAPAGNNTLSPAERSIAEATKAIAKKPTQYSGYNLLAMALARRARETSDVSFYAQAEDALKKSFDLAPGNLDGEKILVWLLLGRHEFAAALDAAKTLNKRVPDDVLIYGFLTDAKAELGNYQEAERAAQWMLDLRPGDTPGARIRPQVQLRFQTPFHGLHRALGLTAGSVGDAVLASICSKAAARSSVRSSAMSRD
jgi:tetratricopeptide (TPR) repeat protein